MAERSVQGSESLTLRQFEDGCRNWQTGSAGNRSRGNSHAGSGPAPSAISPGWHSARLRLTCKEETPGVGIPHPAPSFQCTCRPMAGRQPSKLVMRVRLPPGAPSFNLSVGESGTPPALGAGGRRFKSCRTDQHGCVAQSAEHGPLKPGVVGSIPTAPTMSRNFLMLPLVEFGEDATL